MTSCLISITHSITRVVYTLFVYNSYLVTRRVGSPVRPDLRVPREVADIFPKVVARVALHGVDQRPERPAALAARRGRPGAQVAEGDDVGKVRRGGVDAVLVVRPVRRVAGAEGALQLRHDGRRQRTINHVQGEVTEVAGVAGVAGARG